MHPTSITRPARLLPTRLGIASAGTDAPSRLQTWRVLNFPIPVLRTYIVSDRNQMHSVQ